MEQDDNGLRQGPGLLASLWRYKVLLVVVALNFGVVGYFLAAQQPATYEAQARLFLADSGASLFRDTQRPFQDVTRVARELHRLDSPEVRELASELLDGQISPRDLAGSVSVDGDSEIYLIFITAWAEDAEQAAARANAVAAAYEQVARQDEAGRIEDAIEQFDVLEANLQAEITAANEALAADPESVVAQSRLNVAQQQLVFHSDRVRQMRADAAWFGSGVARFEAAQRPRAPVAPSPKRDAAAAAMLGLMGAGAFAWWRAGRTQSADTSEAPAAVLSAPLLGEIPAFRTGGRGASIPLLSELDSVTAEAYQFVVASIGYALQDASGTSAVITSAAPGDGKTATALNLAFAAARDGRRVVLVDGDERVRGLSMRAGVAGDHGLTDLGGGDGLTFEACSNTVALPGGGQKLQLVPAGKGAVDAAGFFRTPQFRQAITAIKENADFVLIDTPPILSVSDTSAIAGQVDGVILVVNRGTRLDRLREVRSRLEFVGTPLIGYVFNRASSRGRSSYYGYGDGMREQKGNGKSSWTSESAASPSVATSVRKAR